jgi:hypothetical protein
MILKTTWNGYWRAGPAERWQWVSEGAFFDEPNTMALLRTPALQPAAHPVRQAAAGAFREAQTGTEDNTMTDSGNCTREAILAELTHWLKLASDARRCGLRELY